MRTLSGSLKIPNILKLTNVVQCSLGTIFKFNLHYDSNANQKLRYHFVKYIYC